MSAPVSVALLKEIETAIRAITEQAGYSITIDDAVIFGDNLRDLAGKRPAVILEEVEGETFSRGEGVGTFLVDVTFQARIYLDRDAADARSQWEQGKVAASDVKRAVIEHFEETDHLPDPIIVSEDTLLDAQVAFAAVVNFGWQYNVPATDITNPEDYL